MATASSLDEILNREVDSKAVNELVGSLEHQLASPTIRDSSQSDSINAVSRNHVPTQGLVSHGNSSEKRSLQITNQSTKIVPEQGSNTITLSNVNGGNNAVTNQQLYTYSNSVTSVVCVSTISPGLFTSSNNLQPLTSKSVMTVVSSSLNSNFTPTSNLVVISDGLQGKAGTASISSTNAEHLLSASQNGGIERIQTVNAVASSNAGSISGLHKLVTVAAKQKPISVSTVNHTGIQEQKPQGILQGSSVRPQQLVIKNEPGRSVGNLQPVMAQPTASTHVTAALNSGTPSNSNVITINNPHTVTNNPNTVTVVRPQYPSTSHPVSTSQPQIQIVNVPNTGVNPRLQGVSTNPKTLATRMVQPAPLRIAPQAPVTVTAQPAQNASRPPNAGNVGCITLPPGFQLPPGAMIVKNEQGQFMVVNASAGGAATSATSATSQHKPQTTQIVTRPAISVAPSVSPSTASAQARLQQRPVAAARPMIRTPVATAPPRPAIRQPVHRLPTSQPITAAGSGGATVAGAGSQGSAENVKKCKNFLSTLIKLASSQPQTTIINVRTLIQGLIDGNVEPEEFTHKLQIELKSSPQPYLVPFLKKSLPALRQSMRLNNMQIEGVRPPPAPAAAAAAASSIVHRGGGGHRASTGGGTASTQMSAVKSVQQQQQQQQQQRLAQPMGSRQHLLQQQQQQHQQQVAAAAANKNLLHKPGTLQQRGMVRPLITSSPATPAIVREKRKYDSALKEDDDINDVATMGGVNLSEESRNILGTSSDLMSTQLRTCTDTNFLYTKPLQARLNAIAKKFGLEECSQDVINLISHATEERLRNIVEKLGNIAEHRMELYKADHRYSESSGVRSQIKFLADLDKGEKERHDDQEREEMKRMIKSRSKNEDPEQQKLKEKAKAIQMAESERIKHEEANLAALKAIGQRKKPRMDENAASPGAGSSIAGGSWGAGSNSRLGMGGRPRKKQVKMRDLMFLLEQGRETKNSQLTYRAYTK